MSPSNNFISRPVLTTVCSLLIVIVGLIAIPVLPVENLPDIAPPTVTVRATYTGADAISVEEGVTSVLEQEINGVQDMEFMTSNSSADGVSNITVSFYSGTDGDINQVNVQNKVSLAEPKLPQEVRQTGITVEKASNSVLLVYNFTSEDPDNPYSVEFLSGLLDQRLTDPIRRVTGVGKLTYFGNRKLAFRLWLDPDRLTASGLTSADVRAALQSQNRLVPAGQVGGEPSPEGQVFTFTVQLQGRLRTVEEFENLILRRMDDGSLIRLGDVGRVTLGGETFNIAATDLNGVPSVGMALYQLSGSNAVEVSDGVKKVIDDFITTLPPGVKVEKIYDTTDFINASIEGVANALRDAVVLVVLILFLFLQDWKSTLVPGIAIPVALIGTFAGVLAAGFSLNQLTLFGLVLATGLVVDDAITVIEDTSTKKGEGLTAIEAAKATMDELFSAVIATSLVLFAVFVPVLFFPGATGTIYKQFAATIIFSISVSTFNALTFSPMLSGLLLSMDTRQPSQRVYFIAGGCVGFVYGLLSAGGGAVPVLLATLAGLLIGYGLKLVTRLPLRLPFALAGAAAGLIFADVPNPWPVLIFTAIGLVVGFFLERIFAVFNRGYARVETGYESMLSWVLGHRSIVMGVLAGGIVLTGFAFNSMPSGFVPIEDQGYGIGFVQAPDGVSLERTEAINLEVAEVLRSEKENGLRNAAIFSGASLDGNSPNKGLFFFGTENWSEREDPERSVGAIVARLNRKLQAVEGARIFVVEPPAIPGYGTGGGFEFQLLDQSGGAFTLPQLAEQAGALIRNALDTGIFSQVFTQFSPEGPQLEVLVDRDRMAALGIDYGDAMSTFSFYFGGSYVNDTFDEGKVRRVYIQADDAFRSTPEDLTELYVRNGSGEQVPLSEIFTVNTTSGPSIIPRFNLYRSIKIEGSAAQGRSSGDAIKGIQAQFDKLNVPGLGFDWTGISREEVKAGALAIVIFALGILVVFLVLSAQYESYTDPLIILMTVPTAMLGALIFLAIRGEVLNIYAQVGLVMLIGLAAKNGILIVDLANQRMAEGATAIAAARDAAQSRLRPILMTAISSLFGFLPLVLASGAGARSQSSLGTVVFGGLLVATFLSLFVVPVFYVVMKQFFSSAPPQGGTGDPGPGGEDPSTPALPAS
ncbi:RND transporter [Synechococcus sp. RSCCF101]|uniref:efflux RND transporter permease subunit n=1 Tax=Synechococcus sp. RSCCF101 TaxID=2511069 RepID=UPI00124785D1|nr:efflux RND transporter permease subunit [Synechococcus sp. RSCCF101]QEY32965.1 RND transporter [Synechococcus sp. RSCCF101]